MRWSDVVKDGETARFQARTSRWPIRRARRERVAGSPDTLAEALLG
jgi:hypothetical protein